MIVKEGSEKAGLKKSSYTGFVFRCPRVFRTTFKRNKDTNEELFQENCPGTEEIKDMNEKLYEQNRAKTKPVNASMKKLV